MGLYVKLLEMQRRVDAILKDGKNTSDKYDFASDEIVLDSYRPMMDELGLLLIPRVTRSLVHEGTTKSGTTRYLTEMDFEMVWHDVESGEELAVPWYAQGVDLAGEKGVGKAATYAEKYFLLKFFHVPTKRDDPDASPRTRAGELRERGTAAGRESEAYYRAAIPAMFGELYGDDEEKIRAAYLYCTKAESRGYPGVDSLERISAAALPVVFAKARRAYEKRTGHGFSLPAGEGAV